MSEPENVMNLQEDRVKPSAAHTRVDGSAVRSSRPPSHVKRTAQPLSRGCQPLEQTAHHLYAAVHHGRLGIWWPSDEVHSDFSKSHREMESDGVLLTTPMSNYLELELEKRFNVFKLWNQFTDPKFIAGNADSIRAVVGDTKVGADADLINSLPNLEIVASYSVGLDKIDLRRCKEKGIRVTNTPDVLTDDVADAAIGLALSVLRRICECDRFVRNGSWKNSDFGLTTKFSGKSIGIVGLGRIGSAIAKRAEAFGCRISYCSRKKNHHSKYKYYPDISDLAKNSQILIVACSLTEETRHIINRRVINELGPYGILINIGRGAHVDEHELVSALLENRLGGAGLDVFENEPEVPHQLLELENVVLLPHVGSDTVETSRAMADLVIKNLEAHFLQKPLLTPVI